MTIVYITIAAALGVVIGFCSGVLFVKDYGDDAIACHEAGIAKFNAANLILKEANDSNDRAIAMSKSAIEKLNKAEELYASNKVNFDRARDVAERMARKLDRQHTERAIDQRRKFKEGN